MQRNTSLNRQVEVLTKARRKVTKTSFKGVVTQCKNKILQAVKFQKDDFIVFEVPGYIIGYPVFDRDECIHYMIRYLKRMKMQVGHIPPCTLCIVWNKNIPLSEIMKTVSGGDEAGSSNAQASPNPPDDKKTDKIDELIRIMRPSAEKRKPKRDPIAKHPPLNLLRAMARN